MMTAVAAVILLAVSPAAPADAGSPPAAAQDAGNGGGNRNAGGNGNGNGYGTSTTTTTQVEATTTTTIESTTTTDPTVGGGDDGATTTTTLPTSTTTTGPVGSGPTGSESTTTTVAPLSTSTTVVLVPDSTGEQPATSTTSTTSPQPAGLDGAAPPDAPGSGESVDIETRSAFFADFGEGDRPTVTSPGPANPGRLGALFDTWAWTDRAGGGLTGATFEMLAAVIRAIVTAGFGMAVPASVTATLLVLALLSRHRTSDRAIPSAS